MISVIVPVYNTEKYLNRCINSIVQQTLTDFELILIDDGSTDSSAKICDQWASKDNRVKTIHKKNGGASSAKNVGLCVAKGEYISFIDSDDWIEPNMYEDLLSLLIKNKADMVICGIRMVKNENVEKPVRDLTFDIWGRKELLDFFFRKNGEQYPYSICRRLISRKLLDNYRFIEGHMNEDVETSYYLATNCSKAIYSPAIYLNYFKNFDGVTNSRFTAKKLDLLYMWDILLERVAIQTPDYINEFNLNYKRARFTLLAQMHLYGYNHKDSFMKKTKVDLRREVRSAFWKLLFCNMSVSRKLLLLYICIA